MGFDIGFRQDIFGVENHGLFSLPVWGSNSAVIECPKNRGPIFAPDESRQQPLPVAEKNPALDGFGFGVTLRHG